jgi:protein-S-isoprenylcysteine O-methyltransferase Ste14
MRHSTVRAFAGLLFLHLVLAALLFIPAGTLAYWQAWLFLAVFGGSSLAITLYLMKRDPALLERRVHGGPTAEKRATQRIIQTLTNVAFISTLVVPAIDHRLGWSAIPLPAVLGGDVLIGLGFFLIFLVFRENSFAAAIVDVFPGQKVVSSGPYAFVRHPMYTGALVMFVGIPPALGSWWGLLAVLAFLPAGRWRLLDEERFLAEALPGYSDYTERVRYRLLPGLW